MLYLFFVGQGATREQLIFGIVLIQFGQRSASHYSFDSVGTGQREYFVVAGVFFVGQGAMREQLGCCYCFDSVRAEQR